MKELSFIEKDKKNTFHNYRYASEEAIKKAVHEQLVLNGLIFTVSVLNLEQKETTTKKGDKTYLTNVKVQYCFTDVETNDQLCGEFYGTGEDSLDKGTYKALTGAIKYILTTTFLIPTGDDPENEAGKEEPKKEEPKKPEPPKPAPAKPKALPNMTEKSLRSAVAKIEAGEIGIIETAKGIYTVSKDQLEILEAAQNEFNKQKTVQ